MELILVCILLCPLLFWHQIVYLPKEYYCHVPFKNLRGSFWILSTLYGIPLSLLSLIYLRITIFLRRQPNQRTFAIKQSQQRDLVVLRRIFIIIGLLMGLGIPSIVLLFMLFITGEEYPLTMRIMWLMLSLSMIVLSLSLTILTPQLKNIILRKFQNIRAMPLHGSSMADSSPIRPNSTVL